MRLEVEIPWLQPWGTVKAFCTRNCYYRWHRSDGLFDPNRSCGECGAEFSLLDITPGGRSTKTDTFRCRDCRSPAWGGWCMTVAELAARDGWVCAIGGEGVDPSIRFPDPRAGTVDHIIPRSRGGADVPSNVQLACWHHNRKKSNKMPSEMIA